MSADRCCTPTQWQDLFTCVLFTKNICSNVLLKGASGDLQSLEMMFSPKCNCLIFCSKSKIIPYWQWLFLFFTIFSVSRGFSFLLFNLFFLGIQRCINKWTAYRLTLHHMEIWWCKFKWNTHTQNTHSFYPLFLLDRVMKRGAAGHSLAMFSGGQMDTTLTKKKNRQTVSLHTEAEKSGDRISPCISMPAN